MERETLDLPAPVELEPKTRKPEQSAPGQAAEQGPRIRVESFRIGGNQLFDAQRLLALLDDLKGRDLSLAELNAAAGRIGAFYQEQGYALARAYLPPQEVEDGVVRIEVIEGRYGRIELRNGSRTRESVLRQPLSRLESGAAVQGDELERSLLLLSDLPGSRTSGTLRPGTRGGTTDLVVEAKPAPLLSGTLDANNFADDSTGEYRVGGSLNLNSPLRLGDQLSLRLLSGDWRQRYYRAAYQLPIGPWSTRIGLAHSRAYYHVIRTPDRMDLLGLQGNAQVDSLFLTQPLVRSRAFNLNAQLQYEAKTLRDDITLFNARGRKDIGLWSAGISGNNQDRLLGGGQTGFSLTWGHGRLRIEDAQERAQDRYSAGKAGSFDKLNLNAVRLQHLGDRLQLFAQINAQWASGNLDSTEKLTIAGPFGVRAYPTDSSGGTGDQGWQASAELRYDLSPGWQLSAFIDQGAVTFNKRPWGRGGNHNHMAGTGVGATWSGRNHQISLTAAMPMGEAEKGVQPDRSPRFWLQATRYF
ncbi:ShlB/FhaC/HecB family hemolysin secretion/activation protein [Pseudomonas sp. Q1-7]|uniref:ShlB/FhaC/HecB family hemolysin secretion/activation protein n=1 Tax=Pseudomonas sp. Q1-7 TaxID=3020843 RepID=UPI002300170D|nr:ShlB/FhaC/HecB family hemolysin secretion/activation protein [Pseudomonas sp. Q1-7]